MTKEIQLSQGKFTLVDDDDYEEFSKYNWYFDLGYARRNIRLANGKRKIELLHRVIMNTPEAMVTDHINGDKLDNRKCNLRNIPPDKNAWNARKNAKAGSDYKGVHYTKRKKDQIGKWAAKIQVNKKTIHLGYFHSEVQAALAYNKAAKQYFREYAVFNEVDLMNFTEYQELAGRTVPKEKWFNNNASNFAMGLAGETGEVIDYLKKVIYHNHELDKNKVKDELGDLLWYLTGLATILRIDLGEIASYNIEKLKKRYPDGFSSERSVNRVE